MTCQLVHGCGCYHGRLGLDSLLGRHGRLIIYIIREDVKSSSLLVVGRRLGILGRSLVGLGSRHVKGTRWLDGMKFTKLIR